MDSCVLFSHPIPTLYDCFVVSVFSETTPHKASLNNSISILPHFSKEQALCRVGLLRLFYFYQMKFQGV